MPIKATRLLVKLFHDLVEHPQHLSQAETSLTRNWDRHEKTRTELLDKLHSGQTPSLPHTDQSPLALLQAIDRYLFTLSGGRDDSEAARCRAGNTDYWLVRRPFPTIDKPVYAKHYGHLQSWLRYHWIVPTGISGYSIQVTPCTGPAWERLDDCLTREEARLYIGNFNDGVEPAWLDDNKPNYRAQELTDLDKRHAGLERHLRQASDEEATIVVLPELTLCPTLRSHCARWLFEHPDHPFALVLPGSFHQQSLDRNNWFNRSGLLDPLGETLMGHDKLQASGDLAGDGYPGWREDIHVGEQIPLLNTPLGLMAMPICLDFCQGGAVFPAIWQRLGAQWALVPAFGNEHSVRAHDRRAKDLSHAHATRTLLANQPFPSDSPAPGFIHPGNAEPVPQTGDYLCLPLKMKRCEA